ncbi:DUF5703 domain-containing protein [Rhodopirellula sallentina]|uniref:Putative secreted protein n=1 Tax=Rhodopirellula sallentina SM41 TaxID=1263870 RepID=M5TS72_9BACT|nr:DUF5703 domain-containing protein [Rhodopirellula sallentina]EMI52037.1 putative secreted protein [Rhodopirellula sallentina SM41]
MNFHLPKSWSAPLGFGNLFFAALFFASPLFADSPIENYNVVWDSPSENSGESMPAGGGDIGLNVWVEDGNVYFYMQRSGSLAEDYRYLKLGRVRIELNPSPLLGINFRQKLDLQEGRVQIQGTTEKGDTQVKLSIWAEVSRPIIHVEVESDSNIDVTAVYENWRLTDKTISEHESFVLSAYPGELLVSKDTIAGEDNEILFFHRNSHDQLRDLLLKQQSLTAYNDEIGNDLKGRTFGGLLTGEGFAFAGETDGTYQGHPFRGWKLTSQEPAKQHHIRVVTHIDQTDTPDQWKGDLQELAVESESQLEQARQDTLQWWSEFWDRSWIHIQPGVISPSSKQWRVSRNYNLFRYQLGCNALGEYPTRFNGGNLTTDPRLVASNYNQDPDWRQWGGGVFTAQNQRLVYWPMLKCGDHDAILPQMELYRKSFGGARARVKEHFKHDGIVCSEYNSVLGVAVGSGWGWQGNKSRRSRGPEIPFGDPLADANKGYKAPVEKGVMANSFISYHWESQLEHAYMMLEYHRYFGTDIDRYVPFIENAVVFFDEHYRLREKMRSGSELDSNGKLIIFPSTSCETYRGATNPVDVIAGLAACVDGILQLDKDKLTLRDRSYYQNLRDRIPDFTFGEINGTPVLKPAASYKSVRNTEAPQFYPLFPFNRFDLNGKDRSLTKTFRNTWNFDESIAKGNVISWHQDGIFFARMRMLPEATEFNMKKLDDSQRRFPTFWGPGHDWVPDHNWGGSGMLGLQEMLMQTFEDKIYLFPCWPKEWDVDFKLHAPNQTTVEGTLVDGKLTRLKVLPEARAVDVVNCYDNPNVDRAGRSSSE